MNKMIGYFSSLPTWRLVSEKEYKKILTHDLAIHYLKYEILESIEREMKCILNCDGSTGFYAAVRFLFPEVNHLAHLYWGHKGKEWFKLEKRLVPLFMRKHKILEPECGIHYKIFRHGLMHTHHPKWRRKNGKIGWYISNVAKINEFGIFTPEFSNQIKAAITEFISELEKEKIKGKYYRMSKFYEAMLDCGKVLKKKDLRFYRL